MIKPIIRVGIDGSKPHSLTAAKAINAPVLVSANSFWNHASRTWRAAWRKFSGFDVALDSGGFVAMHLYGGYRWTVQEYVSLAKLMEPTWWAQMDFCCEPEIAGNRAAVSARIDKTAASLRECQFTATELQVKPPLVVLQGWKPDDYVHGPAFDDPNFIWPDLVGVGSVCRRAIHGADGLLAVIGKLDACLPCHVRLHLFGVKGPALTLLRDHPRFASMDSMAWNMASRWECYKSGASTNNELRDRHLIEWHGRQQSRIENPQLSLL